MRISDWSSDVCSSALACAHQPCDKKAVGAVMRGGQPPAGAARDAGGDARWLGRPTLMRAEEGRDLSGAFLIEKRADDIDQRAARLDQRASDLEQVQIGRAHV